jgi:hypothetical protein
METTMILYNPFDEIYERQIAKNLHQKRLNYLASELMEFCGYENDQDFQLAMGRTFEILCHNNIPISDHFKKIFSYGNNMLIIDWQLSDLACSLLLINGNSKNPHVAKAQINFINQLAFSKLHVTGFK